MYCAEPGKVTASQGYAVFVGYQDMMPNDAIGYIANLLGETLQHWFPLLDHK